MSAELWSAIVTTVGLALVGLVTVGIWAGLDVFMRLADTAVLVVLGGLCVAGVAYLWVMAL